MQFLKEHGWPPAVDPHKLRNAAILLGVIVFIAAGIAQVNIPGGGDDWQSFMDGARRLVGIIPYPMYGAEIGHSYYLYNPPWVFIALLPILLLPHGWSWGIGCALTLLLGVAILRRWLPQPGTVKVVLLLLSPPMLYILLHGQMDVLILAGVLLPAEWWGLFALGKPQNAIGLLFGIPMSKWKRGGLILAGAVAITMLIVGNWILAITKQPSGFFSSVPYNLWIGLWPFQLTVGVALLAMGISHKDQRFLISASPFLSPYVTTSAMIGPWLAALTGLNDWQAALVFGTWWGAVIYRMLGGSPL